MLRSPEQIAVVLDEILQCALQWRSADNDRPSRAPAGWRQAIDAAKTALENEALFKKSLSESIATTRQVR